jgi:hypothetical protein
MSDDKTTAADRVVIALVAAILAMLIFHVTRVQFIGLPDWWALGAVLVIGFIALVASLLFDQARQGLLVLALISLGLSLGIGIGGLL